MLLLNGGIQYCCSVTLLYSGIVERWHTVLLVCDITVQWYCCTVAYSIVAVILLYSGIVAGRHTVLLQCYYCTVVLLHGGIQNCSCVLFLSSGIVARWNTALLCCVINVKWYCCTVEHSIVVLCY